MCARVSTQDRRLNVGAAPPISRPEGVVQRTRSSGPARECLSRGMRRSGPATSPTL
jgi:hypothetical protein